MLAKPCCRLKIGPKVIGSGQAQVLGMVTYMSMSLEGMTSCTLSIDQLVKDSDQPTISNQSPLAM